MNELHNLCMKLLENETRWQKLVKGKDLPLPDVSAAKKRVKKAKTASVIRWILILAVAAGAYFIIWPKITPAGSNADFDEIFFTKIVQGVFWAGLICIEAVLLFLDFAGRGKITKEDREAEQTYENNSRINEKRREEIEEVQKEHEKLLAQIRKSSNTTMDGTHFYDIPFDPITDYKTFKDGIEYYSLSKYGSTYIGGPLAVHVMHSEKSYVRVDSHFGAKKCKLKEALSVLPADKYQILYEDKLRMADNKDADCLLYAIWDRCTPTIKECVVEEVDLLRIAKLVTEPLTDAAQFLCQGLPMYDPVLRSRIPKSEVADNRMAQFEKQRRSFHTRFLTADDIFQVVRAQEMSLIEKGFVIMDARKEHMLYVALTDHSVIGNMVSYNLSAGEEKDGHGYVTGALVTKAVRPDMASTIDYIGKYLWKYLPMPHPEELIKPEGLSEELFRLFVNSWYQGHLKRNQK